MLSLRRSCAVILAAILFAGVVVPVLRVQGAVPDKDDLSGCPLVHGQVVIPIAGSPQAAPGSLFKFSDHSLNVLPGAVAGQAVNRAAIADSVVKKNLGDLEYLPDNKGSFWAVSGRIVEVGANYLHEAAAMKLDTPALIPAVRGQAAGILPEVLEGRAYLVETAGGGFALLRVLDITSDGISIQYIYQPAKTPTFDVKAANPVDARAATGPATTQVGAASAVAAPVDAGSPDPIAAAVGTGGVVGSTGAPGQLVIRVGSSAPTSSVLEPYLSTFLQQRKMLIDSRLQTLRGAATTPDEIEKKIEAIRELVQLHADGAADVLVDQITFENPQNADHDLHEGVHPCFDALKQMGKAGSDAAVRALRRIDATGGGEGTQSPAYRADLLALVIRAVNGDAVGQFILQQERDATTDVNRRALYQHLIAPGK